MPKYNGSSGLLDKKSFVNDKGLFAFFRGAHEKDVI